MAKNANPVIKSPNATPTSVQETFLRLFLISMTKRVRHEVRNARKPAKTDDKCTKRVDFGQKLLK